MYAVDAEMFCRKGRRLGVAVEGFDGEVDAAAFSFVQLAIPMKHGGFLRIEGEGFGALDAAALVRVADEVVHGGVEVVGKLNQDGDFRFNALRFIFMNGRLRNRNSVGKLLLADAAFHAQCLEILNHVYHSSLFSLTTRENNIIPKCYY